MSLHLTTDMEASLGPECRQAHKDAQAVLRRNASQKALPPVEVVWNKRLRTSAGRINLVKKGAANHRIELNPRYYKAFGKERILATLRHELAHLLAWELYRDKGHSRRFKQLCRTLDGSMNPGMAGKKHAACASRQYLTKPPKYHWQCPGCGVAFYSQRQLARRSLQRKCCRHCRTPLKGFKVTVLR